jgi:hypothetical protein
VTARQTATTHSNTRKLSLRAKKRKNAFSKEISFEEDKEQEARCCARKNRSKQIYWKIFQILSIGNSEECQLPSRFFHLFVETPPKKHLLDCRTDTSDYNSRRSENIQSSGTCLFPRCITKKNE